VKTPDDRLGEMGLALPAPTNVPEGLRLPFSFVNVRGNRALISGHPKQHTVINGFSDLIIDVFGPNVGRHSRSAIGVAGLPMNFAIEIEAEVELLPL
jgi:hypothetical protein